MLVSFALLFVKVSFFLCFVYLLQEWDTQNASQIATEICGFVTILSGTFLLHKTKDMGNKPVEPPVFVTPEHANSFGSR